MTTDAAVPFSLPEYRTIRHAVVSDIPRLLEMGRHFISTTRYAKLINGSIDSMRETAEALIEREDGSILVIETPKEIVGMIGMMLYAHPISGQPVAGEVFWWVEPEHRGSGLRLLRAAENWARELGAMRLHMIAPDPTIEELYARMGFVKIEVAYQKVLVEDN